jgi:hypothetical protein
LYLQLNKYSNILQKSAHRLLGKNQLAYFLDIISEVTPTVNDEEKTKILKKMNSVLEKRKSLTVLRSNTLNRR